MKKPNILFLLTDDQRFNTIGALGNPEIHTPVMDRLVKRGTSFTQATIMGGTMSAVCMPSRAVLHTGKTLNRLKEHGACIPEEHHLLGEWLGKQGYQTYGIGKWHNGTDSFNRSFQDGGSIFFGGMDDHWNVPVCDYCKDGKYPVQPLCPDPWRSQNITYRPVSHIRPGKHSSELFADEAASFLERVDGKDPFFLYVSFMAPHDPRTMPERHSRYYQDHPPTLPNNWLPEHPFDNGELRIRDEQLESWPRTEQALQKHLSEYYAMISHLDEQIGRILDALEASGELENTLIILTGDNGLAVGCHGLMGKQNMYEHSLRVPLIISGPGVPENACSDALVQLGDLFPTLCEILDEPAPDSLEGHSFAHALHGGVFAREQTLHAYGSVQRAVRTQNWKLVQHGGCAEPVRQLFDLHHDPDEMQNLYGQARVSEIQEQLLKHLDTWRTGLGDDSTEWGRTFWGLEA